MKIGVFAACALFIAATPAIAGDWWFVGTGHQGTSRSLFFMDKETLRSTGAVVTAWTLVYHERAGKDLVRYTKDHYRYDCNMQTTTLLAGINYDDTGLVRFQYSIPVAQQTLDPVPPDTVASGMLIAACGDTSHSFHQGSIDNPHETARRIFEVLDTPKK